MYILFPTVNLLCCQFTMHTLQQVAELSRPTSQEVEEVIEHVISGLLDDPSTKLQHKDLQYGCPRGASTINNGPWDEDSIKKCSSSPLQSQSVLTVNRDYLARLLFWFVPLACLYYIMSNYASIRCYFSEGNDLL